METLPISVTLFVGAVLLLLTNIYLISENNVKKTDNIYSQKAFENGDSLIGLRGKIIEKNYNGKYSLGELEETKFPIMLNVENDNFENDDTFEVVRFEGCDIVAKIIEVN